MNRGRPTDYKREYVRQGKKLAMLGATDDEIADFFGVATRTLHRWKAQHADFCHSLKAGKEAADNRVERSLYQRAVGFEHDAVKIFLPKDAADPVYAPYREYVVPDTTACIFWLKNRRKDEWRDAQQHDHSGKVTLENLISEVVNE